MANILKPVGNFSQTKTDLNESISILNSVVTGYGSNNWKTYSHGMFTTVYDYPYLSSSANQLFDLTVGNRNGSAYGPTSSAQFVDQKHNLYTQYEQMLFGYNASGSLIPINLSASLNPASSGYINNPIFINFSRLLTKDEIKKGTFIINFDGVSTYSGVATYKTYGDYQATGSNPIYYNNSPAGDYGILYDDSIPANPTGLLFYQAGVAVLNGDVAASGINEFTSGSFGYRNFQNSMVSSSIDQITSGSIRRLGTISFKNTTELNSTIYFCRANFNDFNYSSNPSYLSSSQIIVKNSNANNDPVTYVTTVGLYSPDNELLAVAKLSQPVKKSPAEELTFRVRLDY